MGEVKSQYSRNFRRGWDRIWSKPAGTIIRFPIPVDAVVISQSSTYNLIFLHFESFLMTVTSPLNLTFKKTIDLSNATLYFNYIKGSQQPNRDSLTFHLLKASKDDLATIGRNVDNYDLTQYVFHNQDSIVVHTLKEAIFSINKKSLSSNLPSIKHNNCPTLQHLCNGKIIHKSSCRRSIKHHEDCDCKKNGYIFHSSRCSHSSSCNCPCDCKCCQKICSCVCSCSCCLRVCNCVCKCDVLPVINHFVDKRKFLSETRLNFGLHGYKSTYFDESNIKGLYFDGDQLGVAFSGIAEDWKVRTTENKILEFTEAGVTVRD